MTASQVPVYCQTCDQITIVVALRLAVFKQASMEENNQQQNIPILCRKKCGFFGSPNFDGLCSKCHRSAQAQLSMQQADCIAPALGARLSVNDNQKPDASDDSIFKRDVSSSSSNQKQSMTASFLTAASPTPAIAISDLSSSQAELQADAEVARVGFSENLLDSSKSDSSSNSPVPSKSPRCQFCRKRVGPAGGYSCRCGGIFCSLHRYSDAHTCSYDYRKAGQDDIRRSNPQIVCSKLPKI